MDKILLSCAIIFIWICYVYSQDTLICKICGISSLKGNMNIAVYKNDLNFLSQHPYYYQIIPLSKNNVINHTLYAKLVLAKGEYAIAFHHDLNKDAKMNKNFLGIPLEPFAFSRSYNFIFGYPEFKDISIIIQKPLDTLEVFMKNY